MLVLSRKEKEVLLIDGGIRLEVVAIRGGQVRIGITAPESVKVFREEVLNRDSRRGTNGTLERASSDPAT